MKYVKFVFVCSRLEDNKAMEELKNVSCGLCGRMFNEQDDVVFCPDCGAPAHRSCWQQEGECIYSDQHGNGFRWTSPAEMARNEAAAHRQQAESDFSEKRYMGVSEREMLFFLNAGTPQSIYRMALMKYLAEGNRKVSFNVFAGIFNPYNQFYKGMSALGILLTLVNFVTSLPQILLYYSTFFTENTELFSDNSVVWIINLMSWIQLSVMALLCVFGDYLYLLYMVKTIKKVRTQYEDEESEAYAIALSEAGRTRWSRVLIGFGLQAVLVLAAINLLAILGA